MNDKGNGTGYRRAANAVRESTTSARAWGVWQVVLAALISALVFGVVTMRDEVIAATTFTTQTAPAIHTDYDGRLKYLERPEALLQLAQATDSLSKVEAAADLAQENAGHIQVIETKLDHVGKSLDRAQLDRDRMLRILDELNVRRGPGQ